MSWNPSGPGWLPPPKPIDASIALIGGGKQAPSGGVPSFASPRGDDTTALTHAVWKEIVEGRFDPSSMASGSNSRLGGLTTASSHDGNMTLGTNPSQYDFTSNAFLCRPLSVCEPCPVESRNHPFCRPYGNRRLVACRVLQGGSPRSRAASDDEANARSRELDLGLSLETTQLDERATNRRPSPPPTMEFQGWEACGKVVKRETRDYLEFVVSEEQSARC